jgi:hypothetical protein
MLYEEKIGKKLFGIKKEKIEKTEKEEKKELSLDSFYISTNQLIKI